MMPYEVLYGRWCKSSLHRDEVGERVLLGPKLVEQVADKFIVRQRLVAT